MTPSGGGADSPTARQTFSRCAPRGADLARAPRPSEAGSCSSPVRRREAEGRQLLLEELRVREAVAQAPKTEGRVLSVRRADALLSAEVVGPHDDRMRREPPRAASRRRRAAPRPPGVRGAASRYRNSDRKRPTPSGVPVLEAPGSPRRARCWRARRSGSRRAVTAAPAVRARSRRVRSRASPILTRLRRSFSFDGAGRRCRGRRPRRSGAPGRPRRRAPATPATAGRPKERAMMLACEVGPPRSRAIARTRRGSRRAASAGESSSATRMEPRGSSRCSSGCPPERWRAISRATSRMSSARSRIAGESARPPAAPRAPARRPRAPTPR